MGDAAKAAALAAATADIAAQAKATAALAA
jgi:hypothetical protein